MPGWGSYVKPKKTRADLRIEARREYGKRWPSDIEELQQIAAIAKMKVKRLPYVPPEDPAVAAARTDPGASITGPCQTWIDGHRAWREAGRPRDKAGAPEPTERQKKLEATRAWNKARYQKTKSVKAVKERPRRKTKRDPGGGPSSCECASN